MRSFNYKPYTKYGGYEIVVGNDFEIQFSSRFSHHNNEALEMIDVLFDGLDKMEDVPDSRVVIQSAESKFRIYLSKVDSRTYLLDVYNSKLCPQTLKGISASEISDGTWNILSTKVLGKLTEKSKDVNITVEESAGFVHTFQNGNHELNFRVIKV